MPDLFASLGDRLLRAGVRPKTVKRYLAELRDHLDDLTAELEANGLPRDAAQQRAIARLGSVETLAFPMASDRRFHSWAARTPWAVFLIAPFVGYAVILGLLAVALVSVISSGVGPDWFGAVGRAAGHFAAFVVPLILAWTLAFMALRQRSPAMWPLAGMGLTIVAATVTELRVNSAGVQQGGEIAIALTMPSAVQIVALLLAAAAPLLLLGKCDRAASQG